MSLTLTVSGNEVTDATRALASTLGISSLGQMCDFAGFSSVANLLPNGSSDTNVAFQSNWGGAGATFSRDTTVFRSGAASTKVVNDGSVPGLGLVYVASGPGGKIPVIPGVTYTFSVYVRGAAGGEGIRVGLSWYDSVPNAMSTTSSATVAASSAGWTRYTVTGVAPAGAVWVYATATVTAAVGATYYCDDAQLEVGATASANVVTTTSAPKDAIFFTPDSSFGIRRAATNLFRHGQCGSTNDWNPATGTELRVLDATAPAPFSPQSVKLTTDGSTASQGVTVASATGQAVAAGVFGAGSIFFKGVAGQSYTAKLRWNNTDASSTTGTITTFTATGAWQILSPASLAVAAGKTGDALLLLVQVSGTRAESFWVAHTMLEKGRAVVAPYVATSGGSTSTHAGSRVQASAAHFPVDQPFFLTGWIRLGWSEAQVTAQNTHNPRVFAWGNDSLNRVYVVYNRGGGKQFSLNCQAGGATSGAAPPPLASVNAGDKVLFIAKVNPTTKTIALSINGGAFTSLAAGANFPDLSALPSTFEIGSENGDLYLDGDVKNFAIGLGDPSNADAAAAYALGDGDSLPSAYVTGTRMFWPADTAAYSYLSKTSLFPSSTFKPSASTFPSRKTYLYPYSTGSAETSGSPSLILVPYKIQPAGTPSAEASGSSALIWAREAIQAWPDGVGVPRRTLTPGPGRLPGSPDSEPHVYRRIQFPSVNIFPSADLYPYADPASPRSLSGYCLVQAHQAPMVGRRVARQLTGVCTVVGGGTLYVLGVKSSDYADNVTRVYLPANTRRLHLTSERKRLDLGGRTVRLSIDT